ncbi:MAG TPA: tetratricopeptide repeat protein [Steroidobacteraceae bacterium]|nr:tetratricopeptide repeat protein [Steroidobacteraceae bacterium]
MTPGRNDRCPCGSGRKYKLCCGLAPVPAAPRAPLQPNEIGALVALVNQGRSDEAERQARALLARHPDAGMLWKILGVALMRQGKEPLPALHRAAQLLPNDPEAHLNLGSALHDRGQWAQALPSLRRALAIRPDDEEALVAAADALRALGQTRESVPLYERALRSSPRLPQARNNLGNAFLELGRHAEAAACYRMALELRPDDAQIHCNLGNAQRQLGLLQEALASTRRALALDPAVSVAHNHLGLVLAALGQREAAAASYRQALLLSPRYVDAHNNLGNVLRELGQGREAATLYRTAIEIDPGRAESHSNLGSALLESRRIGEAARCYTRAAALDPRSALAHLGLATALRLEARHAEAESSCRAALAIDPGCAEALCLLGELRADRGLFAEAEELFHRAIGADPDFPFAFLSIATHRKMTRADTAWLEGATSLLARQPPLRQRINLHFALGKYFDDVERHDEAFGHYREAHELARRFGSSYDPHELTRRIDRIIASFDASFMAASSGRGSPCERGVFIVGMPRSGTSLAEQILAAHPAVFGAGEIVFWDAAFDAHEAAGFTGETGAGRLCALAGEYLARIDAASSVPSPGGTSSGGPSRGGAARVVDKMPANFLHAGLIHAVFPRARIIHMRRHPLDTCLSVYFQNFFNMGAYANDLSDLAHYYGEYLRITDHWRSVLPASAWLEVPYESLVQDQEHWTRRLLQFIDLPWDARCLEFHRAERVVITASKWQVRQKIHAGSIGRWRHYERHIEPLRALLRGRRAGGIDGTAPNLEAAGESGARAAAKDAHEY